MRIHNKLHQWLITVPRKKKVFINTSISNSSWYTIKGYVTHLLDRLFIVWGEKEAAGQFVWWLQWNRDKDVCWRFKGWTDLVTPSGAWLPWKSDSAMISHAIKSFFKSCFLMGGGSERSVCFFSFQISFPCLNSSECVKVPPHPVFLC